MNILDEKYAQATERLGFMVEEAERITGILRQKFICADCAQDAYVPVGATDRTRLSKEFRELCKEIRVEIEMIACAIDPDAAVRAALANETLPPHVRAAILAANEGKLQDEPEGEQ